MEILTSVSVILLVIGLIAYINKTDLIIKEGNYNINYKCVGSSVTKHGVKIKNYVALSKSIIR